LHGVRGWKGWQYDPAFTAFTSAAQTHSAPNSVEILGATDLVHEYFGADSGQWVFTTWQYIPGSFTGATYFIMMNQYDDAGLTWNWSTQVIFDSGTGLVANDVGVSGGTLPMITDQWVEIRVEIDLDLDTQDFYYDNTLLYSGTWTVEQAPGDPGILNIGAVDLFANGATSVYYDDLTLCPATGCITPDPAGKGYRMSSSLGHTDVCWYFDPGGNLVSHNGNGSFLVKLTTPTYIKLVSKVGAWHFTGVIRSETILEGNDDHMGVWAGVEDASCIPTH
jgi:hypothetical protein